MLLFFLVVSNDLIGVDCDPLLKLQRMQKHSLHMTRAIYSKYRVGIKMDLVEKGQFSPLFDES